MRRGNLLAATRCCGRVVAAWVGLKSLFLILALCKRLISTSRKQLPFVAANDNVVGDACDVPSSVTPMTWCRCDVVCDFILCNWCDVSWRDVVRDVYFVQSVWRVVTWRRLWCLLYAIDATRRDVCFVHGVTRRWNKSSRISSKSWPKSIQGRFWFKSTIFKGSWVRISARDSVWTVFLLICCIIVLMLVWKDRK